MVVQLKYRTLFGSQTTLGSTLCYVRMLNVSYYAPHGVSVMQGRFWSCTVNVDAHTLNINSQYLT